jgi:membrane carboxypeptidase/penicillin-binding protein
VAAKVPYAKSSWGLGSGEFISVSSIDLRAYRQHKNYDLVILAPQKNKDGVVTSYRIASGTRAQASVVVLDVKSGEVLALNGGFTSGPYGKFASNNRATRSLRQPGSTVKPFTYLYALNKGMQPNSLLGNSAVAFPEIPGCGYGWSPKNAGGGGGGRLTMVKSLERSVNRSFVNMFLNLTGIEHSKTSANNLRNANLEEVSAIHSRLFDLYDFASSLGAYPARKDLKRASRRQPCLPWLIGSYETTALNMAQAYASIANGGLQRKAVFLNEVQKDKQPLLVDKSEFKKRQVEQYKLALQNDIVRVPEAFGVLKGLKPQAVTQVRSILEKVVERGTARRISKWTGRVAGKTGTTNNSKDAWFIGFNSSIAVAVWTGYDDSKIYPNLGKGAYGGNVALPIFEEIMEYYYSLNPEELEQGFNDPEETPGVVGQLVNLSTGKVVQDYTGKKCGSLSSAERVYFSKEEIDLNKKLKCK